MHSIPEELSSGPFLRGRALELGLTSRMLEAKRFVRIHPRVYRLRDHDMTAADLVLAAGLALPDRVHLTGITRIQQLGLDFGPRRPIRFVIEGDHHLAIDGIFLHRTKKLPPLGEGGVSIEAAFIAYCALARVIDAIEVGDWLLHNVHMGLEKLTNLAYSELWRDGADEALWVSNHLDGDSRSIKESETRAILEFSGLPTPEVNTAVDLDGVVKALGDLVYRKYGVIVEYEGAQHQEDRGQYTADIDRYALFRDHGHRYVQVTNEHLRQPKNVVRKVHRELVKGGYDGPDPRFTEQWGVLFARLRTVLGPRRCLNHRSHTGNGG